MYAVKILHIWQEIFIFYAVLADGEFTQKKRQESQPASADHKPVAGRQKANGKSCRYILTEILFNFRTQVYRISLAMPAIMRRPMW